MPRSGTGRPPKFCLEHRRGRGQIRDVDGHKHRKNARERSQRAGSKRAQTALELESARKLAIGLIAHPDDPKIAAQSVGISVPAAQLRRLRTLATTHFPGIIDSDVEAFRDSCMATLHLILYEVSRACLAAEISPRDLPHAGRAIGHIAALICGEQTGTKYTEIQLAVIGADGQAINPNAQPQVDG